MSIGMSLMSIKSELSFMGVSSIKNPILFPSKPRTDSLVAPPTPPDERNVTPTVFDKMSAMPATVPLN